MEVKKGNNCYFIGEDEKHFMGILTFVEYPDKIDAQHTIVRPEYSGQGLAGELVNKLVSDARAADKKIIPTCSYVYKKLSSYEFDDVRA